MTKDDCIFCKIIKGDIPSYTIFEDDEFKVILDAGPVAKGHALILPKDHYDSFYELPDETAVKVIKLAKKMMLAQTKALNCEGFNIVQNSREAGDQTVPHYHMHLIPRYSDGQPLFGYKPLDTNPDEQVKIKDSIVGAM